MELAGGWGVGRGLGLGLRNPCRYFLDKLNLFALAVHILQGQGVGSDVFVVKLGAWRSSTMVRNRQRQAGTAVRYLQQ